MSGQDRIEQGKKLALAGEYTDAAALFEEALKADPDATPALFELGKVRYLLREYGPSETLFARLLGSAAEKRHAFLFLGKIYKETGRRERAEALFRRALGEGHDCEEIRRELDEICRAAPLSAGNEGPGEIGSSVRAHLEKGDRAAAAAELAAYRERNVRPDDLFVRNKLLCAIEFLRGKTALASNPWKMAVCLTSKCNLRCFMCHGGGAWDLPRHIAEEIAGLFPYLQSIQWRGGEVFLSPWFEKLFERASSFPRLRQGITTNGLLIDEAWADRLLRGGVKLDLSIDGTTRETYEYVRRGASFDKLLRNLELLAGYKRKHGRARASSGETLLHLAFVVMRRNVHELEDLPGFAHRYGFDVIQLLPLTYFPPGEEFTRENVARDPGLARYVRNLLPVMTRQARSLGIRVDNVLPFTKSGDFWEDMRSGKDAGSRGAAGGLLVRACYSPWHSLFIDAGGAVMSQCSKCCNIVAGNVADGPLGDLWNGELMQKYRRTIIDNVYGGACNAGCNPHSMPEDPSRLDLF